jgi:hypothetical protein
MFSKTKKDKIVVFVSSNYKSQKVSTLSPAKEKKPSKMVNIIPTAVYFSNIIGKCISKEYQSSK